MYAVVSTGGKQYRVEPGTQLSVERLPAEPGASVTFDRVLLVGDGDQVTIGTPIVDGASVTATVLGEERGPKLIIFKFKQKVKYRRRTGHRQHLTRVRIDRIEADGRSASVEEAPAGVATEPEAQPAAKPRTRRRKADEAAASADQADASVQEAPAAEAPATEPADAPAKPKRTRKTVKPAGEAEE